MRLEKSKNIDVDTFDGDLLLMNLDTRQVLVLNEAGGVLWLALDLMPDRDQLSELFQEALPQVSAAECAQSLASVLDALEAGGFISAHA